MSVIDIRDKAVTEIIFADKRSVWMTMTSITQSEAGISFHCPSDEGNAYCLHTVNDIDNLIRALEEAKKLGWVT